MRCLGCLLFLVNPLNGRKCFYAMSIFVATVTLVLLFGVIDHLKTIMGTLPERNCKEIISQGEILIISCSLINFESCFETASYCLSGFVFLSVANFRGVSRNSELGWIVNATNCKIPNLNVWDSDVFPYAVKKLRFSGCCAGYNWSSLHGHVRRKHTALRSMVVPFPFRMANYTFFWCLAGSGNACGEHGKGWTST
jgi:hypothetical protein